MRHRSLDPSISAYKSLIDQNPRNIQFNPFVSGLSENFLPAYFQLAGGVLPPPHPSLTHSYPPYSFQLPPLLPLPAAAPLRRSGSSRGFSSPKKTNKKNKDPSFTPKKLAKSPSKIPKKVEKKILPEKSPENVTTVSLPNPSDKELPNEVLPVMKSSRSVDNNCVKDGNNLGFAPYKEMGDEKSHIDMFSGSVAFTISPPPSSLPLPTFSLRPKMSCKTEAAGVDTGATDDLRRLLRLQN